MFRICVHVLVDCTLFVILFGRSLSNNGRWATFIVYTLHLTWIQFINYTCPETMNYGATRKKCFFFLLLLPGPCHCIPFGTAWIVCARVYIEQANNPIRIEHNRQLEKTVETRRFFTLQLYSHGHFSLWKTINFSCTRILYRSVVLFLLPEGERFPQNRIRHNGPDSVLLLGNICSTTRFRLPLGHSYSMCRSFVLVRYTLPNYPLQHRQKQQSCRILWCDKWPNDRI